MHLERRQSLAAALITLANADRFTHRRSLLELASSREWLTTLCMHQIWWNQAELELIGTALRHMAVLISEADASHTRSPPSSSSMQLLACEKYFQWFRDDMNI